MSRHMLISCFAAIILTGLAADSARAQVVGGYVVPGTPMIAGAPVVTGTPMIAGATVVPAAPMVISPVGRYTAGYRVGVTRPWNGYGVRRWGPGTWRSRYVYRNNGWRRWR